MPLLMNWVSDIDIDYKGVYIKQKISFRIYLGVNKINQKKIIFNKINFFNVYDSKFCNVNLKEYNLLLIDLEKYFNNKLKIENTNYGIEFNVFFEGSKGLGLSYNSILVALIIIGYYYIDNINNIDIDNIDINNIL